MYTKKRKEKALTIYDATKSIAKVIRQRNNYKIHYSPNLGEVGGK